MPRPARAADKYRPREQLYIACADMDFSWYRDEVKQFRQWWREGVSLDEMAERLNRDVDEVAILVIDQKRKRKIKNRPGGLWGNKFREAK